MTPLRHQHLTVLQQYHHQHQQLCHLVKALHFSLHEAALRLPGMEHLQSPKLPCQLHLTFSVHDLNAASQSEGFSISMPPPYGYHADKDGDTKHCYDQNDFPSQSTQLPGFGVALTSYHLMRMTEWLKWHYAPEQYYPPQDASKQDSRFLDATCPIDSQIDKSQDQQHSESPGTMASQNIASTVAQGSQNQQQHSESPETMPSQNTASTVAEGSQPFSEPAGPLVMVPTPADGELMGHATKLHSYPNKFHEKFLMKPYLSPQIFLQDTGPIIPLCKYKQHFKAIIMMSKHPLQNSILLIFLAFYNPMYNFCLVKRCQSADAISPGPYILGLGAVCELTPCYCEILGARKLFQHILTPA
ncbi:hypothetical protein OG21DRAFT_1527173 [Imleria badia]|nr:hypothetical protein OG21DRAFT_1527173 [Imleria badia]